MAKAGEAPTASGRTLGRLFRVTELPGLVAAALRAGRTLPDLPATDPIDAARC